MKDCCFAFALIALAGFVSVTFVSCLDLGPNIQVPDPTPLPTASPQQLSMNFMLTKYHVAEFAGAPVPTVKEELELAELVAEGQLILECLERGWLAPGEIKDHESPSP
jgi:hypothetical protein